MDFRSLREDKLRLSQEEFAKTYEVSIEDVQRWDIDSEITWSVIEKIAKKTGMSLEDITGYEKPKLKVFDAKNTWEKADFRKKRLVEKIRECLEEIDITEEQKKNYIDDLQIGIEANLKKPSMAIVGRSDTGKSTLINTLIGMEKMPTSWTPTTSIAVYIKHMNDRPNFMKEDVWIFANSVGDENLWDVNRLSDEEYCNKWKIASGEVGLLSRYGTRQGGGLGTHAGSAVVFVDAPVLLNCDIVDLPGFGTETESDDAITLKAAQKTDILIYLSQADGFMRIEDINYLKENVRNLPVWESKSGNELKPLSNLFVVASQAHHVNNGNEIQLKGILEKGYENFAKALAKDYWRRRTEESGYTYSEKEVSSRFFTYTTDIPDLCERFLEELKKINESLPDIIDARAEDFVQGYVATRKPKLNAEIKKYKEVLENRARYVQLLDAIDDSDLKRTKENTDRKQEIVNRIESLRTESINEYSDYCSKTINTDVIAKKIKEKGIKNNKDDIQCFASQLQDEMQEECNKLLERKGQELSESIKNYISLYGDTLQAVFDNYSVEVDFDAGFAFASALLKIGIIGGLGAYVASEAAWMVCSLSFMLGIGGDIALGAAAFGPVGVAVGLLIAVGIGLVKLFGGGWEKNVSKKFVKSYEDNKIVDKYIEVIKNYWNETDKAFNEASAKLDEEWDTYVSTLREMVNEYDDDKIKENLKALNNIMAFFEEIPL